MTDNLTEYSFLKFHESSVLTSVPFNNCFFNFWYLLSILAKNCIYSKPSTSQTLTLCKVWFAFFSQKMSKSFISKICSWGNFGKLSPSNMSSCKLEILWHDSWIVEVGWAEFDFQWQLLNLERTQKRQNLGFYLINTKIVKKKSCIEIFHFFHSLALLMVTRHEMT